MRSNLFARSVLVSGRVLAVAMVAACLGLAVSRPAQAQDANGDLDFLGGGTNANGPQTEAELVAETKSIRPGQPFTVALHLSLEKGWHVYWRNPGDSGTPTHIKWSLPPGFKAGEVQWPAPQRFVSDGMVVYGYENEEWLLAQITPPANLIPGQTVTLAANADWLICREQCVPQKKFVGLQLKVSNDAPEPDPAYAAQLAAVRARLPLSGAQSGLTVSADRLAAAKAAKSSLNLRFTFAPETTIPAEQLKGLYFYPADESTLAHPVSDLVIKEGYAYRIPLTTSEYADAPLARLRGVLIAPSGTSAGSQALAQGIWIDVPVRVTAPTLPKK